MWCQVNGQVMKLRKARSHSYPRQYPCGGGGGMQTRPPSPLGWLSLGWGAGGPPSVCDGCGQTALEILKQRLLKGQRESTGRHPCRAEPWTTCPPESQGALSQDCGLGGGAGCGGPEFHRCGEREGVPGCRGPAARGRAGLWLSPHLRRPQRCRPSASAPRLSPAFLGALKTHHFPKEPWWIQEADPASGVTSLVLTAARHLATGHGPALDTGLS